MMQYLTSRIAPCYQLLSDYLGFNCVIPIFREHYQYLTTEIQALTKLNGK